MKVWTTATDCGGFKPVSDDTFRFFKALEMIACELSMEEMPKESAISEIATDENVLFHWDLIMHSFDTSISNTLLQDVVMSWFTVRGFSITSKLLEECKKLLTVL